MGPEPKACFEASAWVSGATALFATMGLEMDHKKWMRPKPDKHKGHSATERVLARSVAAPPSRPREDVLADLPDQGV